MNERLTAVESMHADLSEKLDAYGEKLDELVAGQKQHGAILERIARSLEGKCREEGAVLDFERGKQA